MQFRLACPNSIRVLMDPFNVCAQGKANKGEGPNGIQEGYESKSQLYLYILEIKLNRLEMNPNILEMKPDICRFISLIDHFPSTLCTTTKKPFADNTFPLYLLEILGNTAIFQYICEEML